MTRSTPHGILQFSIELGLSDDQTALSQHRRLLQVAQDLMNLFQRYQLSASWALPTWEDSALGDLVANAGPHHEMALLAGENWSTTGAERGRLLRKLKAQLVAVRDRSIELQSLVLTGCDIDRGYDVLAKEGVRAVRTARLGMPKISAPRTAGPQSRSGLVRIEPHLQLAGATRWWQAWFARKRTNLALCQATLPHGFAHVTIRVAELLEGWSAAEREVDGFLLRVAQLREGGMLKVETMAETVQRMRPHSRRRPARSLLRPAA